MTDAFSTPHPSRPLFPAALQDRSVVAEVAPKIARKVRHDRRCQNCESFGGSKLQSDCGLLEPCVFALMPSRFAESLCGTYKVDYRRRCSPRRESAGRISRRSFRDEHL